MNWYSQSWEEAPGVMFAAHIIFPLGIDTILLMIFAPGPGLIVMLGWLVLTIALVQIGQIIDVGRW